MLLRALLQRCDQPGVVGQTQVIIAAERQIGFAVHHDVRRLRTLQHAALAQQAQR